MTEKRRPARVCGVIGLALFAMMVVWLGGTTVASMLITSNMPWLMENAWIIWILNDVPLYALGLPVFLLILKFVPDGPSRPRDTHSIGVGHFLLLLVFCYGVTYVFNLVSMAIQLLLMALLGGSGDALGNNALQQMVAGSTVLPSLIFGALVPAVGEEFMFRYVLRKKLRGASDRIYIFFSALCFSLFHANIAQMLYAFVLGAVFAWVYLYTGKIWLPMLLHFIINTLGLVVAPLALENEVVLIIFAIFILAAVVGGIVIFCLKYKRVVATLMPPTEPGWPYKVSQRQLRFMYQQINKGEAEGYQPAAAVYYSPYAVPTGQQQAPDYGQPGGWPGAQGPMPMQPVPHAPMVKGGSGAVGVCLGNVGMVLYIVLACIMTGINLLAMLL